MRWWKSGSCWRHDGLARVQSKRVATRWGRAAIRVPWIVLAASLAAGAQSFAQEQDYETALIGKWRQQTAGDAGGDLTLTIEYLPNGRYEGEQELVIGRIGPILALSGSWFVEDWGDGEFELVRSEDGATGQWIEKFRFVDRNTLQGLDGGHQVHRVPAGAGGSKAADAPEE